MYKARHWPEVVEFYRRFVEGHGKPFAPMLQLVKLIAASRYASGTWATTSMTELLVVQTAEYDPDGEILRIIYNPKSQEFNFELQETSSTLYKRWNRQCSAENGFQTFERFMQLKKWFIVCNPIE